MWGMQGTREIFTTIPGNLLEDSSECYHFMILGNVDKDSGEYSRTFQGMPKIPENFEEDSGEYSRKFQGMFKKIPGDVSKHYGENSFQVMFKMITGECWPKFSGILEKIGRFIMLLNENRIYTQA